MKDLKIDKELKKLRAKRVVLFQDAHSTPEQWEDLADEYEAHDFLSNAASCRVIARQLRGILKKAEEIPDEEKETELIGV